MDVTDAPMQAEIADSLVAEPEQTVEQPETEQQFAETEQPDVDQQTEEQFEEQPDYQLPSEQEKVFPDDVLQRYAEQRYPDILKVLQSDPTNGALRQLLHDKLNTDIYLEQQRQQFDEPEPEPEPQREPTPPQPQVTREQHFQNLERVVAERTDPEVAKAFHADFLRAFGVPETEIAKAPPEQAMRFTTTASKYMLNLMNTFMGDMLQASIKPALFQAIPGFDEKAIDRWSHNQAWESIRTANPEYASLPAYGTKEFSQTMRAAAQQMPEIAEMIDQLQHFDGVQVPRFYGILARIASGQNVDPALLQKAAASAARSTRRAEVKRAAGNLGSGQSKAGSQAGTGSSKFQTNQDIFDDDTMAIWNREHGRI